MSSVKMWSVVPVEAEILLEDKQRGGGLSVRGGWDDDDAQYEHEHPAHI